MPNRGKGGWLLPAAHMAARRIPTCRFSASCWLGEEESCALEGLVEDARVRLEHVGPGATQIADMSLREQVINDIVAEATAASS